MITLQYNGYNKDVPIHERADQFGYVNASYFNRVFKKYTGMTPTEFMNTLSKDSGDPERSAFQTYYNEYPDLKRYPIKESLEYMQGLKVAADESKVLQNESLTNTNGEESAKSCSGYSESRFLHQAPQQEASD